MTTVLSEKFAVGEPKRTSSQYCGARLTVDQEQIGFEVAFAVIMPFATERVIAMLFGEWLVVGK